MAGSSALGYHDADYASQGRPQARDPAAAVDYYPRRRDDVILRHVDVWSRAAMDLDYLGRAAPGRQSDHNPILMLLLLGSMMLLPYASMVQPLPAGSAAIHARITLAVIDVSWIPWAVLESYGRARSFFDGTRVGSSSPLVTEISGTSSQDSLL